MSTLLLRHWFKTNIAPYVDVVKKTQCIQVLYVDVVNFLFYLIKRKNYPKFSLSVSDNWNFSFIEKYFFFIDYSLFYKGVNSMKLRILPVNYVVKWDS